MADFYKHCNWYTVWDAKTGDLIASGTSAMVARRLGYKTSAEVPSPRRRQPGVFLCIFIIPNAWRAVTVQIKCHPYHF